MASCATPFPFPITKINDTQYLLVLPPSIDRDVFLSAHAAHLRETGYVAFPWSNVVNGTPMQMKFKVWVDLKGMSPCSWTIEHLLRAVGDFGIVLEHGQLACVPSLERMRVVVAVSNLELVPKNTTIWVRGIARIVQVEVLSWIEEPIPLFNELDTTPPQAFFDNLRSKPTSITNDQLHSSNQEGLVVDYDTLYALWATAPPENREAKDKLEKVLLKCPRFSTCIAGPSDTTKHIPTIEDGARTAAGSQSQITAQKTFSLENSSDVQNGQQGDIVPCQISINGDMGQGQHASAASQGIFQTPPSKMIILVPSTVQEGPNSELLLKSLEPAKDIIQET